MAEDDIYRSKYRYEQMKLNLDKFAIENKVMHGHTMYFCKNKKNLEHFKRLFIHFEVHDLSYIRRLRVLGTLRFICWCAEKDLQVLDRDDINDIIRIGHERYKTLKSKGDFIRDTKYLWRRLFPETDEKGRIDETITPYQVRHLSCTFDKSKETRGEDKLTWEEYKKVVAYFGNDIRMQAYITLAVESLGRPQEILYRRMRDVELHDNYAKVWVSDHGKEGANGFLQCIDSFPYFIKLYNQHPLKDDPDAFLFVNIGNLNRMKQMSPFMINKNLKKVCHDLNIRKPITCYSLKRNGVTFRRLRGDSDVEIQHAARWTSTKQLKYYDLSSQDDAFKQQLARRGIISNPLSEAHDQSKLCDICGERCGLTETFCTRCKRPLDRKGAVAQEMNKEQEIAVLHESLNKMEARFDALFEHVKANAGNIIDKKLDSSRNRSSPTIC